MILTLNKTHIARSTIPVGRAMLPRKDLVQNLVTPWDPRLLTGLRKDKYLNFDAQLVEQPCGVSAGAGKLTFFDLTGIIIDSSAGTSTPTKNGNDIEFSAGTIWDLKLSNGIWIPDPYTGYDVVRNKHGTPTDITSGIQDVFAYHQKYGFDRYTEKADSGNINDVPKTINGATIDVSATYPGGTYDHISYPAGYGILPMGAIDFNPGDSADTILDLYDRDNIIGQAKEFWRPEIKDLASYDVGETYQHDADEFCFNYLMTYSTEELIKRLFLRRHIAISDILNYKAELSDYTIHRLLDAMGMLDDIEVLKYFGIYDSATRTFKSGLKSLHTTMGLDFNNRFSLFNENGYLAELGWMGADIPRTWVIDSGDPIINGDEITFDNDASADGVKHLSYWEVGKKYIINCTVSGYAGAGSGIILPYDGSTASLTITANGTYEVVYVPGTTHTYIYCYANTGAVVTVNFIKEIGDTVAKAMDVGSGGGSDTYYNATQSDLSKQPVRISNGIDFIDDDHEMNINVALNGVIAIVTALDDSTDTFTVSNAKITGADIFGAIGSYECKSITVQFEDYILRPSGVGEITEIESQVPGSGEHWEKVDEEAPNDTDYVIQTEAINGVFKDDVYLIPDIIYSGNIGSIKVFARMAGGPTGRIGGKIAIRPHSTVYYGSEESLTASFVDYSKEWNINPETSQPWTWDEILDLQIGVSLKSDTSIGEDAFCSQVYIEIKKA